MLSRILGIIVCLMPCGWGIWSIHAGMVSDRSGPIFGGIMFLFFGLSVILVIITDGLEQIVNKMKGEAIERELSLSYHSGRPYIDPMSEDYIRKLNTPDPNLIHPDDLKREFTATIAHRDGQPPKIIDIKV